MRQMVMVGRPPARNRTTLVSAWRHPDVRRNDTGATLRENLDLPIPKARLS